MTADACREWRGLLAAAALARIDDADEVALRAHLDGCPACRAELHDLTAVARSLRLADLQHVTGDVLQPSPALAERVVDRVAAARRQVRRRRLRRALVAAAAAVVVLGLAAVLLARQSDPEPTTTVVFPRSEEAAGRADLERRDAGTEVRLVASGFDDGDWYWLWLTGDDGDRVSAGTFRGTGDEVDVTLTAALPLDAARRIWVTDGDDTVVLDARI
jgi:anti-sigma factor RsiW